ncbi:LacI family DNA-binding transcriptional regulator [Pantoea agglomerans]|uniref:LacI family DNA-binding transcriptional regulator n=1 Tax=Enterobacter agglomerans TaxID=549 RepID=UPI003C7AA96C
MKQRLKVSEIAALSGVSISTVSRVLAGKANTRPATRDKVLAVAQQQGVLNNLHSGRLLLNNLMVFAPPRAFDVRSDIFYYKVIQGISQAVEPHEVRLRYCPLEEVESDAALFIDKMQQTEAALLIGIDDEHIHQLAAEMNKPCVLINARDRRMRLPSVSPHHQLIGEFSARYLFEQGHRQILSLHCLRRYTMEQRLQGVRDAWHAMNLRFDSRQHLLTLNSFSSNEAAERLSEYLRHCPDALRPTAILASGDYIAAGAVTALEQAGLRVPQDISVMSMDGFNLAAIHDIPLTSMQVPRDELGAAAVRMLQEMRLNSGTPTGSLLLNGRLVVRESVRRIRDNLSHAPVQQHGLYD